MYNDSCNSYLKVQASATFLKVTRSHTYWILGERYFIPHKTAFTLITATAVARHLVYISAYLECESLPWSKVFSSLGKVFLQDCPRFSYILLGQILLPEKGVRRKSVKFKRM